MGRVFSICAMRVTKHHVGAAAEGDGCSLPKLVDKEELIDPPPAAPAAEDKDAEPAGKQGQLVNAKDRKAMTVVILLEARAMEDDEHEEDEEPLDKRADLVSGRAAPELAASMVAPTAMVETTDGRGKMMQSDALAATAHTSPKRVSTPEQKEKRRIRESQEERNRREEEKEKGTGAEEPPAEKKEEREREKQR